MTQPLKKTKTPLRHPKFLCSYSKVYWKYVMYVHKHHGHISPLRSLLLMFLDTSFALSHDLLPSIFIVSYFFYVQWRFPSSLWSHGSCEVPSASLHISSPSSMTVLVTSVGVLDFLVRALMSSESLKTWQVLYHLWKLSHGLDHNGHSLNPCWRKTQIISQKPWAQLVQELECCQIFNLGTQLFYSRKKSIIKNLGR